MDMLVKYFGDHPELGRAIRMICNDEDNHLAYCHEELLRLAAAGHGRTIQRVLRESALAEIRVYRDVSLAVMAHMGRLLHWPKAKSAALAAGIHAHVRVRTARRLAPDGQPGDAERRGALDGPATAAPAF